MTALASHIDLKMRLLAALGGTRDLAIETGMQSLAEDLDRTRIPKLTEERFHLVVLGEFNHGKSSFVNALLGAPLLPTGITPTTATINHVVWAKEPTAHAVYPDGTRKTIPVTSLADWVTVEGAHSQEVHHIEVGYPAPLLKEQVVLVDTPGVNDLNEQRAEITYGYVPRADAVLFLLDCSQALTESERAFLTTRVFHRSRDRMVFVLGKRDLVSDEEFEQVHSYVREKLSALVPDPPIFALSAKRHVAGAADSGMPELVAHLENSLALDRGRILLDNSAADALFAVGYLKQNLLLKQQTLSLSLGELEDRVGKIRTQLDTTQKTLAELHHRIRVERDAIKAQIAHNLEQFSRTFISVLPGQIDAADASDVRRYLPVFIQDKFKEWAEIEGERLSTLLERLAEEVIAVTNENTRTMTAALASRLGPTDGRIDLQVDSFKYDVSIYAVGALGTTVFLFVNSLVGGLLTLAAPILAIVLSSRMSAEVKDQAKKTAPEAVDKAATAIRPHLLRIVDDFTDKLDEFVTSAGDKLYRGISEILDYSIVERRKAGSTIAPLAQANTAQIARLDDLDAEITKLRETLWSESPKPEKS